MPANINTHQPHNTRSTPPPKKEAVLARAGISEHQHKPVVPQFLEQPAQTHIRCLNTGHSVPCSGYPGGTDVLLLRKEVIQPHLPVRLPCYDFVPIASPTFDHSLPYGL